MVVTPPKARAGIQAKRGIYSMPPGESRDHTDMMTKMHDSSL
jgi:hypothetical protein